MDLQRYKGVVKRVYDKSSGQPFEAFFDRLIESLEIAAEIAGDVPDITRTTAPAPARDAAPVIPISIGTNSIKSNPEDYKGALLLSVTPPPVAGADDAPDDDVDYWESKPRKGDGCARLEAKLKEILPVSITVELPGFDKPIELSRGIGSPGIRFVHVSYTIPGDPLGPRVTLMTSNKEINPEEILRDIVSQCSTMYSKEKRKIEPRVGPPPPPPSSADMARMLERDRKAQQPNDGLTGTDAQLAAEDARVWSQNRSPRWQ